MNSEKTVTANSHGIIVRHEETNRHHFIAYDFVEGLQTKGSSHQSRSYQDTDEVKEQLSRIFNTTQNLLYKRTLYGLSEYSRKEIAAMTDFDKSLIDQKQKSLWIELNKWKNQVTDNSLNHWLKKIFCKGELKMFRSEFAEGFTKVRMNNRELNKPNRFSFQELGIDKFAIADKMIQWGFLPADFFELA